MKKSKKYRYPEIKVWEKKQTQAYKKRQRIGRRDWFLRNRGFKIGREQVDPTKRYEYYKNFLQSDWWKKIRAIKLKETPCCFVCSSKYYLQVHHAGYKHIWDGKIQGALKDTYVLCGPCHKSIHEEQKERKMTYEDTAKIIWSRRAELTRAIRKEREQEDLFSSMIKAIQ